MKIFISSICLSLLITNLSAQTLEWAKTYGSDGNDKAYSIALDDSGNLFTTGSFLGTVDFDTGDDVFELSTTNGAGYIRKTDSDGAFDWAIGIDETTASSVVAINGIAIDESGYVYIAGGYLQTIDFDPDGDSFLLTSIGGVADGFFAKYSPDGEFIWAHSLGSVYYDVLSDIKITGDGNILIAGTIKGEDVDMDPSDDEYLISTEGGTSGYVEKLTPDGEFIWVKFIESESFTRTERIRVDADGNIYSQGFFTGTSDFDPGAGTSFLTATSINQLYIQKLNTDGNFIWAKTVQPDFEFNESFIYAATIDTEGNLIITGKFKGTIDFDPSDSVYELTSNGFTDIFIVKLDADGEFLWADGIGGIGVDIGLGIALDNSNSIYICGVFQDNVDFDPSFDEAFFNSLGSLDGFILKLDKDGDYMSNIATENETFIGYNDIGINNITNELFIVGYFNGTVDIDPTETVIEWTSVGGTNDDAFVLKFEIENVPANLGESSKFAFKAFPNPANSILTIALSENIQNVDLEIFDYTGNIVFKEHIENNTKNINTNALSNGLYTVVLTTSNGDRMTEKIAIIH